MEPSIRKNWIVALCLGVFAILSIVLIVNEVNRVRRQMLLKQTHNDLKWIGMALHNYHDAFGCFPPVVVRHADGSVLHSWRSLVQNYLATIIKTDDRYDRYDTSEPWDSIRNQQSMTQHRFGSHPFQFLAVVGPETAWSSHGSRKLADFTDGNHNTVLVIAVRNTGVVWHQPVDAAVSDSGTLSVNGRPLDLSSDLFVLTADGGVRYSSGIRSDTLSALITINSNDNVGDW